MGANLSGVQAIGVLPPGIKSNWNSTWRMEDTSEKRVLLSISECFQFVSHGVLSTLLPEKELNNVVKEEDGEWICFSGGNNHLGTKKYRGSNSSDGGNTGDEIKIAGRVIGSGGEIVEKAFSISHSDEVNSLTRDET
ncbi:hypothetical protein Tco_0676835 [Tanacetum coccineum]